MRLYLIAYIVTAVAFFGMDFLWLSFSGSRIYKARLGALMLDKPDLVVAGGFYLLYVIAIIMFAVTPAVTQGSWARALWAGALLGAASYGTYDLTNQATLAGWSSFVSVVDMCWGIFATSVASVIGFFITAALI